MPLTPGQKRLYSGDYNYTLKEHQGDGTVIVTISGGEPKRTHRLHIYDLWGKDEEVLSEEEVISSPPKWIKNRLEEAERGR